jgi:hypothetical protein
MASEMGYAPTEQSSTIGGVRQSIVQGNVPRDPSLYENLSSALNSVEECHRLFDTLYGQVGDVPTQKEGPLTARAIGVRLSEASSALVGRLNTLQQHVGGAL